MAETTSIEWTDATWSPWEGCTKVSPACDHCYAEGMNRWLRKGENWGPGAPRRQFSDEHWMKPVRWNERAQRERRQMKVFPSVCDPFDNEVDPALRARFFGLISRTPHLTWLLLTKRIGNAEKMMRESCGFIEPSPGCYSPRPNVWLGATVVTQEEVDRDVPKLLRVPATVRFLSIEPMLGPIELNRPTIPDTISDGFVPPLAAGLDWVICGGESGPKARPMHPQWGRDLRDQCAAAGVPFLFKQWGEFAEARLSNVGASREDRFIELDSTDSTGWTIDRHLNGTAMMIRIGKKAAGRLLDGRTHDGFPEVAHA